MGYGFANRYQGRQMIVCFGGVENVVFFQNAAFIFL